MLPCGAPLLLIPPGNSGSLYFFNDFEHIEDNPLCTSTKTCRNEPGSFSTYLEGAVSMKPGDYFSLFFSDDRF